MNQADNFANEELEKIALASLFDVGGEIPPLDLFFFPTHRAIYRGFVELEGRDKPPDIITLTQIMREIGQLESVGGPYAITALGTEYRKPQEITQHALGELRALRAKRQQKDLAKQMQEGSIEPEAARNQLDSIINSADLAAGLCVRSAGDILNIKLDPHDCLLGDRLLAKSGKLVIAVKPVSGKAGYCYNSPLRLLPAAIFVASRRTRRDCAG